MNNHSQHEKEQHEQEQHEQEQHVAHNQAQGKHKHESAALRRHVHTTREEMGHVGEMPEDGDRQHDTRHDTAGHADHSAHGVDHSGHEQMFRRKFWVSLVLSVPVLIYSEMIQSWLGYTPPPFPGSTWIGPIFAVVVFVYGGWPFLKMAIPEVRNRKPGMMTLISLAISVAFVYSVVALFLPDTMGFFWELVTLIDIMLLGHWLEMRSVRQASGALDELAKLMPDTAERLLEDGETETVPVTALRAEDVVLVRPGASVPADGEIIEGASAVNEAMITGESKPVDKEAGDRVIAGTINGDGSLRIHVSATGDETTLAGIMRLVDEAQNSKSGAQLLADRAAGWLFYIALAAAALTALAWILATGFDVEVIERVATVLVIACPHALGLAVPLVVAISTALAAKNGILVRNRGAMESARDLDTVIFDKTGTLTAGEFKVVNVTTAEGWAEDDALALAASIEGDSEHTIARGIRLSAEDRDLLLPDVHSFEAIKGRGVKATHEGKTVYVGGPRLLEMLEIRPSQEIAAFEEDAAGKGESVVLLIVEGETVAAFALADVIREESRLAVERLHKMGIEVAMLTGDSEAVAKAVAAELGIDTYFAQVLPEHKDSKVAELQRQGKKVAMVGDGVNDAPALTRADVGIAIGSGTDVAVESAGIVLVRSNPLDVVKAIELSGATRRKMVQNLWWAAGYNIVAIPLAAGVLVPLGIPAISPAIGAGLMSLSTIIVALNAQLLRRVQLAT
ncbi:copper-translocating P-type ATPase [bacterium]|nr:copper-translocating P-type ATPase [bacterium]